MGASTPFSRNTKPRLTQDEKTAETRRRLLDSAILCLVNHAGFDVLQVLQAVLVRGFSG